MFRMLIILKRRTGVATSLVEATATIAVGAALAGAAVGVVSDKVQDARIAQARQDVQSLADAINSFEKDNTFFPIFISAGTNNSATAPGSSALLARLLTSKGGDLPVVDSGSAPDASGPFADTGLNPVLNWDDGVDGVNVDSFENQFNDNTPRYLNRGAVSFSPERGFAGPYLSLLPGTDPWGNKYECNARYLDDRSLTDPVNGQVQSFQTVVISSGPNEKMQTPFQARADGSGTLVAGGDDIAYRVR